MDSRPTPIDPLANALHAAETWLQRQAIEPTAVVVVTLWPSAALGVWLPGLASVQTWPTIDEAGAELAEAVAPLAHRALDQLTPDARTAVAAAVRQGGRLQVLLLPAVAEMSLRLAAAGGAVQLAAASLEILH